ncbi:crossover junction endodeoxyribonuclease RuvC [Thermithiobacillus plumbiphilus]|uniref:Crossover junction endodeoxyribonuclease RuvC n=1 Tax=Thermithiobacillus plumbiphilus TaxID=1729899 RepID=A0ABU9D4K9_9PROT
MRGRRASNFVLPTGSAAVAPLTPVSGRLRILGIDPGSVFTGFGVIDLLGAQPRYVTSGCIRLGRTASFTERLRTLFVEMTSILEQFKPDEAAIERVFLARNPDSALKLGQARGAAIVAVLNQSLAVHEYSALQIKQATVGRGHAQKEQVQHMVQVLLNLPGRPQADAADALACALCHAHTGYTLQRMTGR